MAAAREGYTTAIQRSDLDWPEAVYEAFAQFESIHGTVETVFQTARKIEKESEKLARRREKTAQTMAQQVPVEAEVSNVPATAVVQEAPQQSNSIEKAPTEENDNRVRR